MTLTALNAFAARLLLVGGGIGCGVVLCQAGLWWLLPLLAVALLLEQSRRWRGSLDTHGTARVATFSDANAAGLIGRGGGLHIGRLLAPPLPFQQAIRGVFTAPWTLEASKRAMDDLQFSGQRRNQVIPLTLKSFNHCAIFGPSGCGKSAAIIIPSLLSSCHTPAIILDVKAELHRHAYEARRRQGRKGYVIDPFRLVCKDGGDSFNPLATVDPGSRELSDFARDIASALVVRNPNEQQPFFNDMATIVLTAFVLFAMRDPNPAVRNLEAVADVISNQKVYQQCLEIMATVPGHSPSLKRLARQAASLPEKERGSVVSTVATHLAWLNSELVAETVRNCTVDPLWLKDKRKAADLWLIIPPERMASNKGYIRFLLTGIIRRLMAGGLNPATPVLVLLDEIATAGHLEVLEMATNLMRGWGVKFVFVYQSVGQLQESFPGEKARTFLANTTAQIYFKPNDLQTAKEISDRIGTTTVLATSDQQGGSTSTSAGSRPEQQTSQRSTSWSVSRSEQARQLFRPEEVLACPQKTLFVFAPSCPPLIAECVFWFESALRWRVPQARPSFARRLAVAAVVAFIALGLLLAVQDSRP